MHKRGCGVVIRAGMKRTSVLLVGLAALPLAVLAQTTAFTYQGRLNNAGAPANGIFDLRFSLHDAATNGASIGSLTNAATPVSNGLFTVALDFGAGAFPGADRWLELAVRTNGNPGAFTALTPRQALASTPYALRSLKAGSADAVPATNITGTIAAGQIAPAAFTNINAVTLGGLTGASFWRTGGNTNANPSNGTFLGTSDNLPLEMRVNSQRALRLEPRPESPNVIGGSPVNYVTPGRNGAFIGGGGTVGAQNVVTGHYASVVGGLFNLAGGAYSTASGYNAEATGEGSLAMGWYPTASGPYSISLGQDTIASGPAAIALGFDSVASGTNAVALGSSTASGWHAFACGVSTVAAGTASAGLGHVANANHDGAFVWADFSTASPFVSSGANQFLVRATGGVGINKTNPAAALDVAGGIIASGDLVGPSLSLNNGTARALVVNSVRASSSYASHVALVENLNTNGNSGPALRVVAAGNTPAGALNVSANGTGLIAQFGNNTAFVSQLTTNGTWSALAFNPTSDRNAKENFEPVRPRDVLEKVAGLAISRWNFKAEAGASHIGPMAQDFYEAFGTGTDDRHITTVDADGVALAAIQGLNEVVKEKDAQIQALEERLSRFESALSKLMEHKTGGSR